MPRIALSIAALAGLAGAAALQALPWAARAQEPTERIVVSLTPADSAAYLRGEGGGMALAAELNGFPGPRHVLQVADSLGLTAEQRAAMATIEARMSDDVRPLGAGLAATELALDSLFASGAPSRSRLDALLDRWGSLSTRLRAAHLRAHIAARMLLTPTQLARYRALAPGGAHAHTHEGAGGHSRAGMDMPHAHQGAGGRPHDHTPGESRSMR